MDKISMILCKCGCKEEIIITKRHRREGIPKFINYHYGRCIPNSVRKKIGLANKGKHTMTEEHKKKLLNYHLGIPHSEETRMKISNSNMGKKCPKTKEHRRKLSASLKGTKHTKETREKMSLSRMGEGNNNWRGGIDFEPYTYQFNEKLKEKIRERDNNLCQLCGKTKEENGRNLTVHHLDYVKENCNEDNLITLCISCNFKANYNRIFWTGFFTGYLLANIRR